MVNAMRGRVLEAAPERVVVCLNALAACEFAEGHVAKSLYESWQGAQPDPAEWPSSKYIRDTFKGSWKRAMAASGRGAILDVLVSDLTPDTTAFSPEEMIANVREYDELGRPLVFDDYRDWARKQMLRSGTRQPRYVRSALPIIREFGSWSALLLQADLPARADPRSAQGRGRGRSTDADYERARCVELLRDYGNGLTERPTMAKFDFWARAREQAEKAAGRHVVVPRAHTMAGIFGSWIDAMHAGGLITDEERDARAGHRGPRRPDRELMEATAEVVRRHGIDAQTADYTRHRAEVGPRNGVKLPSIDSVCDRFRGWDAAKRLAAAALREQGVEVRSSAADGGSGST